MTWFVILIFLQQILRGSARETRSILTTSKNQHYLLLHPLILVPFLDVHLDSATYNSPWLNIVLF